MQHDVITNKSYQDLNISMTKNVTNIFILVMYSCTSTVIKESSPVFIGNLDNQTKADLTTQLNITLHFLLVRNLLVSDTVHVHVLYLNSGINRMTSAWILPCSMTMCIMLLTTCITVFVSETENEPNVSWMRASLLLQARLYHWRFVPDDEHLDRVEESMQWKPSK